MSKRAVLMMTFLGPQKRLPMKEWQNFSQIYDVEFVPNHEIQTYMTITYESVERRSKDNKKKEVDLVASALGDQASVYFENKFSDLSS